MATKSTKKSTATTAKKRPVAKSAKATKTTKTTKSAKAAKKNDYQSFKLSESKEPFMSLTPTKQTLYWLILALAVVLFSVYTFSVSQSIEDIYDQIDEIRLSEDTFVAEPTVTEGADEQAVQE